MLHNYSARSGELNTRAFNFYSIYISRSHLARRSSLKLSFSPALIVSMQSGMFIAFYAYTEFHVKTGISVRFTSVLYEKEASATRLKFSCSPTT